MVLQIHLTEPEGDILLFLTSQEELDHASEPLHERMKPFETRLEDSAEKIQEIHAALRSLLGRKKTLMKTGTLLCEKLSQLYSQALYTWRSTILML